MSRPLCRWEKEIVLKHDPEIEALAKIVETIKPIEGFSSFEIARISVYLQSKFNQIFAEAKEREESDETIQ